MGDTQEGAGVPEETTPAGPPEERIPAMQALLDNPFLLLFAGVAIPAVFYTIWGIMEIAQIPIGS